MIYAFVRRFVEVCFCCWMVALLPFQLAHASCDGSAPLRGVNLAGAEFNSGKLPGRVGFDYIYPTSAELNYFSQLGMNVIRLPFRWERVQRALFSELDQGELNSLAATLSTAKSFGLCVILDVHNFGGYAGKTIGSAEVPADAFIDLWKRLAARFANDPYAAFGLMNEPAALKIGDWAALAQRTVLEIRNRGAGNLILVSGGRWSGVHEWSKPIGGTSNAQAFARFQDPARRALIEVHQYADSNFSGTSVQCLPPSAFSPMFDNVTSWAKANGQKLFLGEFGVAPNGQCLQALGAILASSKDESVWRGWAYWAAGRWWRNYPLSIEPQGDRDAPQTAILKPYLGTR